jgi:hypothetical protein
LTGSRMDVSDIMDRLNDVANKCDDILEKVSE